MPRASSEAIPITLRGLNPATLTRQLLLQRKRLRSGALGDEGVHLADDAGRALVDLRDAPRPDDDTPAPVPFLAKWDTVIMGYDRRARILPERHGAVVGPQKNGDLLPTLLVDGFVAATWATERAGSEAILEVAPLERIERGVRTEIETEGERLIRFVEPDASSHGVRIAARAERKPARRRTR